MSETLRKFPIDALISKHPSRHRPQFLVFSLVVIILLPSLCISGEDVATKGYARPFDPTPATPAASAPGLRKPVGAAPPAATVRAAASGPLQVLAQNPRYFTDGTGKAILLTGSHTWMNFQDLDDINPIATRFDYGGYIDTLVAKNHNFFRQWTWEQAMDAPKAGKGYWYDPLPYQRTGPGQAQDGKNKFDLTKFNQAYFDRLRSRVILAGQNGIYVSIMLFDGWSIENKDGNRDPWYGHPFNLNNNINQIDGDQNNDGAGRETHTLADPAVTALQETYVRKVIDTVNDLDNVLFEISNESPATSYQWQYHFIDFIHTYESSLPNQHPVGITVPYPSGDNAALYSSPADWISPNGDIDAPPPADGRKVILYDMDHLCGVCPAAQYIWKGFTRGTNPIFMDPYDWFDPPPGFDLDDPVWEKIRKDMGYVRTYADRMNLAQMRPRGELASTGYALANASESGAEYLVYLPSGGGVVVDLRSTHGALQIEWFNPGTGQAIPGGTAAGGALRTFTSPFGGETVLYLYQMVDDIHYYLPVIFQ